MIKGGYILQPRIIQESDISTAPPYVREIWNYLLRSANSKDNKYNGHEIKRGQLFRNYQQIRDDLAWYVGYRRMTYNENHTKKAMKALREALRITTTKELGGVLITICNYDYYQNPKNYEKTNERTTKVLTVEPMKNHTLPDNNKNNKNNKNITQKKFYDLELLNENISGDPLYSNYKYFVNELFGKNKSGIVYSKVLLLKDQITFKNFQNLSKEASKHGNSILDKLKNMENSKDLNKKYESFYLTLLNWIKR